MKEVYKILVVNVGSTSTKLALYENESSIYKADYAYSTDVICSFGDVREQVPMRTRDIDDFIESNAIDMATVDAIAARGVGRWGSYHGGAYRINETTVDDCKTHDPRHVMIITPILVYELAKSNGIDAYLYDVVPVDEIPPIARVTGCPIFERRGAAHTLNTKGVARIVAKELGSSYDNMTFIVCHMGGGIAANLHHKGKIIEVVLDDEGTFSPDRSGRVPCLQLIRACYSGKYSFEEMKSSFFGKGGLIGYLGINDCIEIEKMIEAGDENAERIYSAMAYQIAKDIGSLAVVVSGKVDRIILTGGIANSKLLTSKIKEYVDFIAPIEIRAKTVEMDALAAGIIRVLRKEEEAYEYLPGITL